MSSATDPCVRTTIDDARGVALLQLNRPQRLNAVVPALVDDLLAALETAATRQVRAVVLTGNGRAFCAGHDLKEAAPHGDFRADSRARVERIQHVTRALKALPQPLIAAVHGYAIGAGAEFALGSDLILAEEDAVFAFPEVSLGLSITGGASKLLPMLVGPTKAKELVLLGEHVPASTAHQIGIVNTLVDSGTVTDRALELAGRLAERPVAAATMAKRALDHGMDSSLESALELEVSHAVLTETSTEVARSSEAFVSRSANRAE